jgi:hypothetical protein
VREFRVVDDVDVPEDVGPSVLSHGYQRRRDDFRKRKVDQVERALSGVDQQIELLPQIVCLRQFCLDGTRDSGAPRGQLIHDVANGRLGDLRKLPLSMRKANLQRLLARRPEGIFIATFEQGDIGPDLFRKACEFGLEGLVSKHRDRGYRPGRSPNWVKVKNPKHPAMTRVMKSF